MSDTPDRRHEDARMEKIETIVEKIRVKIFNGMSTSIKSTENKVDYIDKRNTLEHGELSTNIKDLSKKFDKMLWFLMTSSIAISGGIILAIVKGWIS